MAKNQGKTDYPASHPYSKGGWERRVWLARISLSNRGGRIDLGPLPSLQDLRDLPHELCQICGEQLHPNGTGLGLVVPAMRGGTAELSNLYWGCTQCVRKWSTRTRSLGRISNVYHIYCKHCGHYKEATDFPDRPAEVKAAGWCKQCRADYQRQYRIDHVRDYAREYQQEREREASRLRPQVSPG